MNISKSQLIQREEYDKQHQPTDFKIGQSVLIRNYATPLDLSKKLHPNWYGPCVITNFVGDTKHLKAITLLDLLNKIQKTVAIANVKPHIQRKDNTV